MKDLKIWRYYYRFYKGDFLRFLLAMCFAGSQAFVNIVVLVLIRHAFDTTTSTGNFRILAFAGIIIIVLYIISALIVLGVRRAVIRITQAFIQRLREEIIQKFYISPRYYNSAVDRSKLHAIVVQDTERLDNMNKALFAQILPALFVSFAISAVLIYFNWLLFLLVSVFIPLLFLTGKIVGQLVQRRIRVFHRSFETFSKGVLFALQMMDLTKTQSAEQDEIAKQKKYIERLRHSSQHKDWMNNIYSVIQSTLVACSGAVVLVVGGILVVAKKMSLGEFLSFYTAVTLLRNQLQTIFTAVPFVSEGRESLETLYNWFEINDPAPYSGNRRIDFKGKIVLEDVSFQYDEQGRSLFEEVDLEILSGQTVAITGPNGAGKSTIANLILGFYRPQKGQLYADGHPYSDLDIAGLRRFIRIVRQDPVIFPGTILQNITYGCPDAELKQVMRAAETALANNFIQKLPRGYETYTGENGMLLSGGQRQRIAIARALLGTPRFLILDEPTSHLEREVIDQIAGNLQHLDHACAILIISHDIEILGRVQQVYLLQEGRLVVHKYSDGRDVRQTDLKEFAKWKTGNK
jgi:ATP-binding cassette, subfamily B, bacterial